MQGINAEPLTFRLRMELKRKLALFGRGPKPLFFVPQISQIYTDLDLFGLWDDADFSSSDYAELSDEKSAKSAKSA